jgi:hypothetical protein
MIVFSFKYSSTPENVTSMSKMPVRTLLKKILPALIRYQDEAFLVDLIPGYKTVEEEPNTFSSLWLKRV